VTDKPESGSPFKDHFSGHARNYAAHRPGYPAELFDFLAAECRARDLVWDCATGNGQAARLLASRFRRVVATDASAEQIASAEPAEGVDFYVAPAEASALPAGSVDLVTVAQALHWFNIERFFEEADRVLKPGGLLACWSYHHCRVEPAIDELIESVFAEVEHFWPPETAIVVNRYRDIILPFHEIAAGPFSMTIGWSAEDLINYMKTWSASRRYLAEQGSDPVEEYAEELRRRWGTSVRDVVWPLIVRVGRKRG
jgi:ubiquinone/menaquinone biosynthesis C-methylase UbiE